MCWFHLKILDKTRSCSWRMERKLRTYGFLSPESPSKQKHISWIKFIQFKTSPFELPFLNFNVQNVYQINIFQSNQFMHKIKKEQKYSVYLPKLFGVPCHTYPTSFSLTNFPEPLTFLKPTRFSVSVRGPILWSNCLSKSENEIDNFFCSNKGLKKN